MCCFVINALIFARVLHLIVYYISAILTNSSCILSSLLPYLVFQLVFCQSIQLQQVEKIIAGVYFAGIFWLTRLHSLVSRKSLSHQ